MKKHFLFVALATLFTLNLFAQDAARPTTAPAVPTMAEEHVMALYCSQYQGNTLNFTTQGWGSAWETLTIDGTKIAYTQALSWDALANFSTESYDLSGYEKIHFDVWAPEAAHVKFTVEALGGYKKGIDYALNAGWNTIDADTAWYGPYAWTDLKCVIFEAYTTDGETSYEGNPFAFTNIYFWSSTHSVTPPEPAEVAKPTTAPAAPNHDEEDVMAMYSSYYPTNNVHFNVLGWGGVQTWETLKLGADSTTVLYCQDMKWEMMTCWDQASYDFSAYDKFHFDIWAPFACHIKVTFEALGVGDGGSGWKHGIDFALNEGWNNVDCDPVWWNTEEATYDWTDVKYIAFEGYTQADGETSAEGSPFAFTNLYWWKPASPKYIPATAPAAPTLDESKVQALFSGAYQDRTFNFAPQNWGGAAFFEHEYDSNNKIWHSEAMTWDAFTNWDASSYNLTAYDMMHADVYVTMDAKLQFTIEALGAGDGGSGWKNGLSVDLVANQWNSLDIDLLNAPFDSYDFTDMRYLILEGFKKTDGSSAEGTPLSIGNVYFWNSMDQAVENIDADQTTIKRMENGQLVIFKNGVRYNVLGTKF